MFKFFQDRRRVRELAATGREPAAPEQQLVAVREISRLLPAEPAFEFIEDRAWNSRSLAVRSEACRVLLLSNTGRGLRGVLRQIVVERESRPPWSYWRDFGVPIQLQFLGREAVGSLELHGKFILKQMEVDGFEAGEEDANSLIRILQGMGSCAAGAVGRFSSSVSWHRKHSRRAPKRFRPRGGRCFLADERSSVSDRPPGRRMISRHFSPRTLQPWRRCPPCFPSALSSAATPSRIIRGRNRRSSRRGRTPWGLT
jgi:hypothetical protein